MWCWLDGVADSELREFCVTVHTVDMVVCCLLPMWPGPSDEMGRWDDG